jgi:hypothetical protein
MAGLEDPHQCLTGLDFRRNADTFSCARSAPQSSYFRLPVGSPLEILMGDPFMFFVVGGLNIFNPPHALAIFKFAAAFAFVLVVF